MNKYTGHGEAAVGTDKTILNLFRSAASPVARAGIVQILLGCDATPADQATDFLVGRTTALGTEGSGFSPVNLDPDSGAASESDFGVAHGSEPTYTSNKELLRWALNQRATFQWTALGDGYELILPATQNNGAGLKSSSSTGTPTCQATIMYIE